MTTTVKSNKGENDDGRTNQESSVSLVLLFVSITNLQLLKWYLISLKSLHFLWIVVC